MEMNDKPSAQQWQALLRNMNQYSTIYIAFRFGGILHQQLSTHFFGATHDLRGKKIIPLATSGGSGMGNTNKSLAPSCVGADLRDGKVFSVNTSESNLKVWAEGYY